MLITKNNWQTVYGQLSCCFFLHIQMIQINKTARAECNYFYHKPTMSLVCINGSVLSRHLSYFVQISSGLILSHIIYLIVYRKLKIVIVFAPLPSSQSTVFPVSCWFVNIALFVLIIVLRVSIILAQGARFIVPSASLGHNMYCSYHFSYNSSNIQKSHNEI